MYVVMNELHIPKDGKATMTERFGKAADNMKQVPGCLEFLFLDNENEDGKQVVFTKWDSKESYEAWTQSEAFKKAHGGQRSGGNPTSGNELNKYHVAHHT